MKLIGIIPARGGSKGVPRKNLRLLLGKSLIERTFESAMDSGRFDRLILSTDDVEAAELGKRIGLEVPFVRPAVLAQEDSSMLDVILHAVEQLHKQGYSPDAVMILQPTSPLRTAEHIRRALEALLGYDSVCSVVPLPKTLCPHYVMKIRGDGLLDHFLPEGARYTRRQDVPQAYTRDGTIYVARTEVVLVQRRLLGPRCRPLVLDVKESLSIDTEDDWNEAEQRLSSPMKVL